MVRKRIDNTRRKHKRQYRSYRKQVLRENVHQEEFQEHFVLVPANKAKNNVLVVCKQYYLDVAATECCNGTGPRTHNEKEHLDCMAVNSIKVPSNMAQLPQLLLAPQDAQEVRSSNL